MLLGVTQEQHADRCRLFAQWKQFDWPILHDPINLLEAPAVPIVVAIDEHGIVRAVRPRPETFEAEFLDKTFADDAPPGAPQSAGPPDPASLRRKAEANPDAGAWRAVGRRPDHLGRPGAGRRGDRRLCPSPGARPLGQECRCSGSGLPTGCATSRRGESPVTSRLPSMPGAAPCELDPNQYIWRRRIEQYGPRLAKPYAFYDWVVQAKAEISRRGETPVPLTVEPYGSELAGPVRDVLAEASAPVEPDPRGQIHRDEERLIEAEVVVVPARVRPGQAARVHLTFRPNAAHVRALEQRIHPATGLDRRGRRLDNLASTARGAAGQPSPSRLRSAVLTSRSRHPRPRPEKPASQPTLCTTPASRRAAAASSSARTCRSSWTLRNECGPE